jgi:predicted metal-dependent phosphoesterase TrpH
MPRIELHCHSIYSDGTLTPAGLVERAVKSGVSLMVLTDHDSVSGGAELAAAGAAAGIETRLGIEINCAGEGSADRVHVLGYGLDPDSPGFRARLEEFRARRTVRAKMMVETLRALGFPVEYETVRANAHETVGRPHVADALRRLGLVKSRKEAFDRFLAKGKAAYVPSMGPSPAEAIALIRDAGGVACLAHPQTAGKEPELDALAALGLGGVEVRYGAHTPSQVRAYGDWASARGLAAVGGSDYHGPSTGRDARLGVEYEDAELAVLREEVLRCS